MKKNKIIILIIVLIVFVLISISFLIYKRMKKESVANDYKLKITDTIKLIGDYDDPSIIEIKSDVLSNEHCVDNICVSVTKVRCNKDIGSILYTVTNTGNAKKTGYFMISFDNNDFYLKYDNLDINQSFESQHNYSNIDLSNISDFKLKILDDSYSSKFID